MGYTTVETGLADIIKRIAGYDDGNVVVDDYSILAKGKSSRAVVLRRGPSQHEPLTMGSPFNEQNIWIVNAELYVASSTRRSELAKQAVIESQKIVDEVRKWPQLNNTAGVLTADVLQVSEVVEGDFGGGRSRSKWWQQIVEVQAVEIVSVALSE